MAQNNKTELSSRLSSLTHRQIFTGRKTKRSLGTELDPLMAPEQLIVSERGKELASARQGPHVEGVQESDYLEVDLFGQAEHVSFWCWSRFRGRRWRLTERVHDEQTSIYFCVLAMKLKQVF